MSTVACIVAESQELSRMSFSALLKSQPGFEVMGEAGTVSATVRLIQDQRTDLLILDTRLPGVRDDSVLETIHDLVPGVGILALVEEHAQECLTAPDDSNAGAIPCCGPEDCIGHALAAGAHGVVTRSASPRSFFTAARKVASGLPTFPPEVICRTSRCLGRRSALHPAKTLSSRERQVAILISEGLCNKEIGSRLEISPDTVKKHVGQILLKLQLRDRLQIGLLLARADVHG